MTLARLVKRQLRNLVTLFSISLFSFAFCHHPGLRALEQPTVASPLPVDHPYYEAGRVARRAHHQLAEAVAPAIAGRYTVRNAHTVSDALTDLSRAIDDAERRRGDGSGLIRISSRFGMRLHPILKRWKLHNGVDFAAPHGTEVRAVADGVVLSAGWSGGAGRLVKIDHGDYVSGYAHLSRFAVQPGAVVKAGEPIGKVGASGLATGPHLHFMIQKDGTYVDPLNDGISRLEPIQEAQVLVNVERGLGLTARVLGNAAGAILTTAGAHTDVSDLTFDGSFL